MNKYTIILAMFFVYICLTIGVAGGKEESIQKLLPAGCQLINSTGLIVKSPYDDQPIPIVAYTTEIVINGKWGVRNSEFGWLSPPLDISKVEPIVPSSAAMDSKGNIYILDFANNRIKKYDNQGNFIRNIKVPSMADINEVSIIKTGDNRYWGMSFNKTAEPYYEGKSIIIDSNDILYYHLERHKTSESTRVELWIYKEDKFVKKINVNSNVKGILYWEELQNCIFLGERYAIIAQDSEEYYNVTENRYMSTKQYQQTFNKEHMARRVSIRYVGKDNSGYQYVFELPNKNNVHVVLKTKLPELAGAQLRNGMINVAIKGDRGVSGFVDMNFDTNGKLVQFYVQTGFAAFENAQRPLLGFPAYDENGIRFSKFVKYE